MKIASIKLKNFKAFKDVEMKSIRKFCLVVGTNGSGKSTLFSIHRFARTQNVSSQSPIQGHANENQA